MRKIYAAFFNYLTIGEHTRTTATAFFARPFVFYKLFAAVEYFQFFANICLQ
jgi:hypothetical protein